MSTCFLFAQHLTEESCLSLKLNHRGEIESPLAQRPFIEIKALTASTETYLIASGQHFSLFRLELPWLTESKARAAIPFALEEQLTQNFDLLHFAFDREHYQEGHYLIVAAEKTYLQDLISKMDQHQIHFDLFTIDWFALRENELAMTEKVLLVNDAYFKGALTPELIPFYLQKLAEEREIYCFKDSMNLERDNAFVKLIELQESSYLWLAQRLLHSKPINLCQGELEHGNSYLKTKRYYQAALIMSLLWLMSILVINGLKLYSLNKQTADIDAKIATIYHEFFPQAKQVISPKFRISQLLKSSQGKIELTFWTLVDKLSKYIKNSDITLEQLRFQNQTLTATIRAGNFVSLETLQSKLKQDLVQVKQTQASAKEKQIEATLELSL